MQNYHQFIIPRLNGNEIKKKFKYYLSLVKNGIAGFIIFGGELESIREGIKRLQNEAELPLIIASDLEQGLGQQITGGTLFPPAMAVASAILPPTPPLGKGGTKGGWSTELKLLRNSFKAIAEEAGYAGINTIFAPVLDINTNPCNPIISVRAFGEDRETVSFFGCEMIKSIQNSGIAACGKHFPGHGDTQIDSHIKLPKINRDLRHLNRNELVPFKDAIKAGVKMIMLGHLSVPAIDPSGTPVSISEKTVRFIRDKMKYKGILITDAMNMGGIGKYSEEKAASMALRAGVDLILHPTDTEKTALYLREKNIMLDSKHLDNFRKRLISLPSEHLPDFDINKNFSLELTEKAIKISGDFMIDRPPFLIILNDDQDKKGKFFYEKLKQGFPNLKSKIIKRSSEIQRIHLPENTFVIVAIFSETKAWKGGASNWVQKKISHLQDRSDLFVSFGSPYLLEANEQPRSKLRGIKYQKKSVILACPESFFPIPNKQERFPTGGNDKYGEKINPNAEHRGILSIKKSAKIIAYWDSESAQQAVAEVIINKL